MELVRFTTYDDVELAAHLYLPEGKSEWSPGLLVCHGFGSSKERHALFGQMAAASGFAALVIDLRGHGESGGQVDANIFNDVAAGLLYLQNRPEVNPMNIAIRGSSMGGWLSIHTAAHLKDVSPVVAYCPANEMMLMTLMEEVAMVQRGHASPMITGPLPRVNVNSMMQLLYRVDLQRAVRRVNPRPVLLVHCEGDEVVPAHVSQRLYDDAREPKTLWLLPGCDHQFAQHDPATNTRLLDWLKAYGTQTGKLSPEDVV
ncbi:MAG TPA: alpha/beta fold hydrolase [Chloroflexia bacterium]|jgi:hypothetical protein